MSPADSRLMRRTALHVIVAVTVVFALPALSKADLVRLKNGGEVRGTIGTSASGSASPEVTIETLTGATVVIDRAQLAFVTRRPPIVEEYETRARQTTGTVAAQWDLAEWCRKNGLRSQRDKHLGQILEVDPGNEDAHRALNHVLHNGAWMTRDEIMTAEGYVKHKGKWVTPQELELIEKSKAELDAEREWFAKVRLWNGWLTGRNEERREKGLEELKAIDDPSAIPALSKTYANDSNLALRSMYLGILENIPGQRAVPALVRQSLFDVDHELRYRALNALKSEHFGAAAPLYMRELKNDSNAVICRAGAALARVGDDTCVPQLIEALVTTHKYQVAVPEKKGNVTFAQNGQFSLGGAQIAGVTLPPELVGAVGSGQAVVQGTGPPERVRMMTIKYDHQNLEVLDALRKLTGESFGYDERTWKLWWTGKKSGAAG